MAQQEIRIKFPKIKYQLVQGLNTFVINKMRCRTVSVIYMILHLYNLDDEEILVDCEPYYVGERWAVDETWSSYQEKIYVQDNATEEVTKYIPTNLASKIKDLQIELVLINVGDNNPLEFTECMLMNKEFEGVYHESVSKITEAEIGFINNSYANLYSQDGSYLQVIRPKQTPFKTTELSRSVCTVLAPHLDGEDPIDKPENLFLEFIYQHEQTTNIKSV